MGFFDFLRPKRNPAIPAGAEEELKQVAFAAFPGGPKQIEEETLQLHALLRGKLSKEEAKRLLTRTKALLVISEDKSKERIVPSIVISSGNKLTEHEGFWAYQFFTGISGDLYGGGDGSSETSAVVINATSSSVGIQAEYKWIETKYGPREKAWTVEMRMHGSSKDGKSYETFNIKGSYVVERGYWRRCLSRIG